MSDINSISSSSSNNNSLISASQSDNPDAVLNAAVANGTNLSADELDAYCDSEISYITKKMVASTQGDKNDDGEKGISPTDNTDQQPASALPSPMSLYTSSNNKTT
ncbi:MAG: hypothetical protein Q8K75_05755 [Chlamydiales bacterium]|nr:hypothetical protein [Chlamydiales bacterium]